METNWEGCLTLEHQQVDSAFQAQANNINITAIHQLKEYSKQIVMKLKLTFTSFITCNA